MTTAAVRQSDIQAAIRQFDLAGQPVCVHSSLHSFGHVTGGAEAVVRAFLEEGCTLVVPTYSYSFAVFPPPALQVQRNGWDYDRYTGSNSGSNQIYTPTTQTIDEEMGAIPAAVLNIPQRSRGDHPLNSFSAVGQRAGALIAGQSALNVYAPLQALVEAAGSVLLMGVGLDKMTLLHLAEQEAGRIPFRRWANDRQGQPQMVEAGSCSDGFEHFAPTLHPWRREARVGESQWQIFPAQQALEAAAAAIRANPSITHCSRVDCERCRDALLGGPILT
ncbi:MAG: AAC(3) family N-acetyltransferase [Caldilineaceae bacterium]|nr:AAC(3) family N-acetyltransferase [Caldilineaceae bacterium]